jgi:predicted ferric reductase
MEGNLKFGIKTIGDYTKSLRSLDYGDNVNLWGPYGQFGNKYLSTEEDCVFIGGGIGVTPFLSMWDHKLSRPMTKPKVTFYYLVDNKTDASFDNDIKKIAIFHQFSGQKKFEKHGHRYILHESKKSGFITAKLILSRCRVPKKTLFFLCGPKAMTDSLIRQLATSGIPSRNIITEDFDYIKKRSAKKLVS